MSRNIVLLALFASSVAHAVPTKIAHQGRLFDSSSVPLTGDHDLTLAIFDDAATGTELWSETLTGVTFNNGYYTVILGTNTPLDPADFDGSEVYVELTVDSGTPIPTRLPLDSVPYAFMAANATNLSGGIVDATEIRVNGTTVIDSDGEIDGAALPGGDGDTLGDLICSVDQVAQFNGSDWACADGNTVHTHDAGDIDAGTMSIDRLPVGSASTDVAAGDHLHSYNFADIGGAADITQLPVGGGSNNVAAGDHIHSYNFADIGGSAAFGQLPVGTVASTVAEGDHGHSAADVGAIPSGGLVPVGASSAACNSGTEGAIRYEAGDLEWCNGSDWSSLTIPSRGTAANPGDSCLDILTQVPSAADGTYYIDPNGVGAFEVQCDMTSNGGGWTIISDPCQGRDAFGRTITAIDAATENEDGQCRFYTRDGGGSHFYTMDFAFGAGFTEFKLVNFEARANAASGDTSEIIGAHVDWSTIISNGDISFGGANQSAPITSYAAAGDTTSCRNCQLPWPGAAGPIALGASDTAFRIAFSEAGGESEGWYPWYLGEIHLR